MKANTNSLRMLSYYTGVFGMLVFCWFVIAREKRQHRAEIHSLCYAATYGSVLNTYNDIVGLPSCVALCMNNNQCESCTYDDTSGTCSLNSLIRLDFPTCNQNVKYVQLREHKCETSSACRICDLYLYSVPGELRGYVEVYLNGVLGTICDDDWEEELNGLKNADVLCRSFGYSYGTPLYPLGSSSYYNGSIMMDSLACVGTEMNIFECNYDLSHNCVHAEDVRVRCFEDFHVEFLIKNS